MARVPYPRWASLFRYGELTDRLTKRGLSQKDAAAIDEVFVDIFERASQEEEANYDALSSGQGLDASLFTNAAIERISLSSSNAQTTSSGTAAAVEWDDILDTPNIQNGWTTFTTGDNQLVADVGGELVLSLMLQWDTYEGGGEVQVSVTTGTSVFYYTFQGANDVGSQFNETAHFQVAEGDVIKVLVKQTSGSDQDLIAASLHATIWERGASAVQLLTYEEVVQADGPLAWWRLGEASGTTAYDSSGNSYDGTYSGSPVLGIAGAVGGDTACTFDGTNDYVLVDDELAWDLDEITLEIWAKTTSAEGAGSKATMLGHHDGSELVGNVGINWHLYENSDRSWSFSIKDAVNVVHSVTLAKEAVPQGEWAHLVGTFDGTDVRLYLNGAEVGTPTTSPSLRQITGEVRIGKFQATLATQNYFKGELDEAAIYDYALTPTRILAHAQRGA